MLAYGNTFVHTSVLYAHTRRSNETNLLLKAFSYHHLDNTACGHYKWSQRYFREGRERETTRKLKLVMLVQCTMYIHTSVKHMKVKFWPRIPIFWIFFFRWFVWNIVHTENTVRPFRIKFINLICTLFITFIRFSHSPTGYKYTHKSIVHIN